MRRKLLIVSVFAATMLGLTSCGSKSANSDESVETVQIVDEKEAASEEIAQQSETTVDEVPTEVATEENSNSEQDGDKIVWYMDSEGLKSDELGILIKKDNDDEEQVLAMSCGGTYCDYYDGDINEYVSEYPIGYGPYSSFDGSIDMQKANIGDVEYAYALFEDGYGRAYAFVAFVENGIAVSRNIYLDENETVEDILNMWLNDDKSIVICDEFPVDCMAYMTDDGIFCPALGMKFIGTDMEAICFREVFNGVDHCFKDESVEFMTGLPEYVDDEVKDEVKDAQDAVEKCLESNSTGYENWIVGEMETRNFGKYTYYGKGRVNNGEYGFGNGMTYFCSDDTEWSIKFTYFKDGENYIDCIESLE